MSPQTNCNCTMVCGLGLCHFQQYFSYIVVALLVEETKASAENHQPATSYRYIYHILYHINLVIDGNKIHIFICDSHGLHTGM